MSLYANQYSEYASVSTADEPVSVADLKEHGRFASSTEDALIYSYIVAAREYIEKNVSGGLLLAPRSATLYRNGFPVGNGSIRLPAPIPASTDVSLGYIDTNGSTQTLVRDTDYTVTTPSNAPGEITPIKDWPDTNELDSGRLDPKAVQVTMIAGSTVVPELAKQAIKLLAANWYEHREEEIVGSMPTELNAGMERISGILGWGFYA